MDPTTPPWQVDLWDLEADFAKVEQQWTSVREILDDPARFEVHAPSVSGWGCGEHAVHIVIAATGIAKGIANNLAKPERDQDRAWSGPIGAVLQVGDFPRGRAKAPEQLDPRGRRREEVAALLPATVAAWAAIRARAENLRACPARFPHFAFGYLTSTEWVRFCAIHTAHHLALIRDIEGAAATPAPR